MESPISNQALPAGTRIEEFVIERVLGSGGFGITYLARDSSLGRQVVIKENLPVQFCFRDTHSLTVAPRHTTGEDVENFKWSLENFSKESAMLASLDHPGIVKVLRSFEALGTAYFVMPFVEGLTLDELAQSRKGKPFSEVELRGLLERVLGALGYLHDRGIYHRDIKPGNLLITTEGIPVLIDFGSARQRLSERSMTVVESAGYTPFEQLQSRGNVGPWSDLYALGGTLVKLITGEVPPKAMDRMRNDPFLPLAKRMEMRPRFSTSFLQTLDQSLAVEEDKRWQDAGKWLAALRGEVALEMTHSRQPPRKKIAPVSAIIPRKKVNFLPWIIASCVVLSLVVLAKFVPNKVNAIWAKYPEPRGIGSEQEYQARIAQAKERQGAAIKMAMEQRAARAELEKQTLDAKAKANEEAEAKAKMEKLLLTGSSAGEKRNFEIATGVNITMCWIPPGEFMMDSPVGEEGHQDNENQHRVTLTEGFWLAQTETTQAQWRAVMGSNPSHFEGGDLPVETVSWNDIVDRFIPKANQTPGLIGRFALPTEAQWEYACRAGTTGAYAGVLDQMAWYRDNSDSKTHSVSLKQANAWGLHDMHGNVWEWCADRYYAKQDGVVTNPKVGVSGSLWVVRGGGWNGQASYCRSAFRYYGSPSSSVSHIGFRLALSSSPLSPAGRRANRTE